jgi:hypothetical protein
MQLKSVAVYVCDQLRSPGSLCAGTPVPEARQPAHLRGNGRADRPVHRPLEMHRPPLPVDLQGLPALPVGGHRIYGTLH